MKLHLLPSLLLALPLWSNPPSLLLLQTYHDDINVTGWVMSEKLDGVRAYWDGRLLRSRSGNIFAAPQSFVKDFPPFELDGELWSERGAFEKITSITRQTTPHDEWRTLTYNIFELPNAEGNLTERLNKLQDYLARHPHTTLRIISQKAVASPEALHAFLKEIEDKNGEGVVVRDPTLPYQSGRSATALKVKSYQDAECVITGYTPGQGKYAGMTGALLCRTDDNISLRIGSGLNDAQREHPPKIGTLITYKYYGLTANGKPRFPVFMRTRHNQTE